MRDILILLRIELKRLFKSKLFYVSLFIGLALSVGGFIECAKPHLNITNGFNGGVETYPFSVFNSWMGMFMGLKPISTSYLYIFMLLAALPYCGFFCRDNKNQYILQYYSRMSKNKIHAARFIATFISGGLVAMLPLLLNLCATMMFIPALKPSGNGLFIHSGAYIMGNLFCEHPLIYVLIYVLQFFIYGGSFALVSLAVSFFIDNTFLVIISPFVTYYGLGIISTLCKSVMNIYSFNPMALLSPATKLQDGMLFAYICEPIIICVICGIIFFMKGKNNEAL